MLLNVTKNGMINCSLGDDGIPSYEDTCSFTCNTGYELTGNDTRICQSNGNWSGNDDVCRRGMYGQYNFIIVMDSLSVKCFYKLMKHYSIYT